MNEPYVHGYQAREAERLLAQARTLSDVLHAGTSYPAGASVLEVGCGVGGQTTVLATRSPKACFTAVDVSVASLAEAANRIAAMGLTNVRFVNADLFALPFEACSFDHVFVCFVLEHLAGRVQALGTLRHLLRPGGTLTVIEGDHGSVLFHPDTAEARSVIDCQVELQRLAGGNARVGRELYPLLRSAGFDRVTVEPRQIYVDSSRPDWVDGFTRGTFIAMIEGVAARAVDSGLITREAFDLGLRELRSSAEEGGVFCYTFFKAVAR